MNFFFASTILQTIIQMLGVRMAINLDMLSNIACIECGGDVEYIKEPECLRCKNCQKEYAIINGIPMMGGIDDRNDDSES